MTLEPVELRPFSVRFGFQEIENDEGAAELWLVSREWFAPPVPSDAEIPECFDWTPLHERTLADNAFRYRRYAERLLKLDLNGAARERNKALAFHDDDTQRNPPAQLDGLYLLGLEDEVQDRRRNTNLDRVAGELGMSRTTLWRRRKEAQRRRASS